MLAPVRREVGLSSKSQTGEGAAADEDVGARGDAPAEPVLRMRLAPLSPGAVALDGALARVGSGTLARNAWCPLTATGAGPSAGVVEPAVLPPECEVAICVELALSGAVAVDEEAQQPDDDARAAEESAARAKALRELSREHVPLPGPFGPGSEVPWRLLGSVADIALGAPGCKGDGEWEGGCAEQTPPTPPPACHVSANPVRPLQP